MNTIDLLNVNGDNRGYYVMHIEDDENANWILKARLRTVEISCYVHWMLRRENVARAFDQKDIFKMPDIVVCDGNIPTWENHIDDVLLMKPKDIPMVVWTASVELDKFRRPGILEVFYKDDRGVKSLVEYIRERITGKT